MLLGSLLRMSLDQIQRVFLQSSCRLGICSSSGSRSSVRLCTSCREKVTSAVQSRQSSGSGTAVCSLCTSQNSLTVALELISYKFTDAITILTMLNHNEWHLIVFYSVLDGGYLLANCSAVRYPSKALGMCLNLTVVIEKHFKIGAR